MKRGFHIVYELNECLLNRAKDENAVEVDFGAFDFGMPHLTLTSSIGNGLGYISKFTTSRLSGNLENGKPLLDHLLALNHHGEVTSFGPSSQ